jgi:hypothetical protein
VAAGLAIGLPVYFIGRHKTQPANTAVPPDYQALYSALQGQLDDFQTQLNQLPGPPAPSPIVFGCGLSYADDNIGPRRLSHKPKTAFSGPTGIAARCLIQAKRPTQRPVSGF